MRKMPVVKERRRKSSQHRGHIGLKLFVLHVIVPHHYVCNLLLYLYYPLRYLSSYSQSLRPLSSNCLSNMKKNDDYYFFTFLFCKLFSLRILDRFFMSFAAPPKLFFVLGRFLARSFSFPLVALAICVFAIFFARRRCTRASLEAFACLRSSFVRLLSFSPREGSPLGTTMGKPVSLVFEDESLGLRSVVCDVRLGRGCLVSPNLWLPVALHRWTRSVRFANLSCSGSRVSVSSTHSRS
jgi:hypothetical protein